MRHILATFTVVTFVHVEENEVSTQYVFPGVHNIDEVEIQTEILDDFNEGEPDDQRVDWETLTEDFNVDFNIFRAHEVQTATRKEVRNRARRIAMQNMTPEERAAEAEVLRKEMEVEEGR